MNILVDVDGVVVDNTGEVLRRYNLDFGDHLTNWDIKDRRRPCGGNLFQHSMLRIRYGKIGGKVMEPGTTWAIIFMLSTAAFIVGVLLGLSVRRSK